MELVVPAVHSLERLCIILVRVGVLLITFAQVAHHPLIHWDGNEIPFLEDPHGFLEVGLQRSQEQRLIPFVHGVLGRYTRNADGSSKGIGVSRLRQSLNRLDDDRFGRAHVEGKKRA